MDCGVITVVELNEPFVAFNSRIDELKSCEITSNPENLRSHFHF